MRGKGEGKGVRKRYYCFDRGDEGGGTLAREWIESQLVEGVCDVCGLGKCGPVRIVLDAGVAGGV
jgi:hypothetical protein